MDPGLLDAIVHKDPDAKIMAVHTDSIEYETSDPNMTLGNEISIQDASHTISLSEIVCDENLLKRQTEIPIVAVPVQVARTIFIVHSIVCFLIMTLGFVPYYILDYDESFKLATIVFLISTFVMLTAYILLNIFHLVWPGSLLLFFLFTLLCWVGSLSALSRSLAPLQAASISFAQCIVVLCYVVKHRSNLNEWFVFWLTFITGVLGWISGLYVFIVQHDWIAGTILFFFVVFATPPYMALQVFLTSRYSVAEKHKLQSIIHFYIDPVSLAIQHWKSLNVEQS